MDRVFLDTCVLFPPRLRALLLGLADRNLFAPVWSAGVAAEWAHLCARRDPEAAAALPALLARMAGRWPDNTAPRGTPEILDLPDANDAHVLAAAIAGRAPIIVTLNLRDFPARSLGVYGIRAEHPDSFVLTHWLSNPDSVTRTLSEVWPDLNMPDLRRALKKSGMPRLGKAIDA